MSLPIKTHKSSFSAYPDKNAFEHFQASAKNYYKIYQCLSKDKKGSSSLFSENKLRDEIKKWFFSLSIESRIKIATVESEWVCSMIFQMYAHYHLIDPNQTFQMKEGIFNATNEEKCENKDIISQSSMIPTSGSSVNTISLKKVKNKEIQTSTVTFSKNRWESFKEIEETNILNYFNVHKTERNEKSLNGKWPDIILSDVRFCSVHHTLDCMTFSPNLLLDEALFDYYFKFYGNRNYFQSLIQPIYFEKVKLYTYKLPDWIKAEGNYSIINYLLAFIEQAILIKFLINCFQKETHIVHSLIDEQSLSNFFQRRKDVINYINNSYDKDSRGDIFRKMINVREIYSNLKCEKALERIIIAKRTIVGQNYEAYAQQMQVSSIFHSSSPEGAEKNVMDVFSRHGNIMFVDMLIFHTVKAIWKIDCFFTQKIFEGLLNLHADRVAYDLLNDENNCESKPSKKKKKGKGSLNQKSNQNGLVNNLTNSIDPDFDVFSVYFIPSKSLQTKEKMNTQCIQMTVTSMKNNINDTMISDSSKKEPTLNIELMRNYIDNDFLNEIIAKVVHSSTIKLQSQDPKINTNNNIITITAINSNEFEDKFLHNKENRKSKTDPDFTEQIDQSYVDRPEVVTIEEVIAENTVTADTNSASLYNELSQSEMSLKSKKSKKKKEHTFFLYETVKKKKEKPKKEKGAPEVSNSISNLKCNEVIGANPKSETLASQLETLKSVSQNKIISIISSTMISSNPSVSKSSSVLNGSGGIPSKTANNYSKQYITDFFTFSQKLHNDILAYDFKVSEIIEATSAIKNYSIKYIEKIILNTLTGEESIETDLFGSFASGLMIESSDIDIRIIVHGCNHKLLNINQTMESIFLAMVKAFTGANQFESVIPIYTASVPLIKIVLDPLKIADEEMMMSIDELKKSQKYLNFKFSKDEIDKIKIDLSFIDSVNWNGVNLSSVKYCREKISLYPEIRPILRVMKRYFLIKKMNNCFNGGLSSFCLFLLILAYVQFRNISPSNASSNFARLLLDFLEFYKYFDFRNYLVDVNIPR